MPLRRVSRFAVPFLVAAGMLAVLARADQLPPGIAGTPSRAFVRYRVSLPEPQHHWMQVEVTLTDLDPAPLELRMSQSSPGRYSIHDFAKNVYDVQVLAGNAGVLAVTRGDPSGWVIPRHGDSVTVRYKVFGDRVDGTYLAVDPTHLHMNMPAALMWARGLEDRPATIVFEVPAGARWQVATQLHPGSTPLEFTAPNLQYLMDSPVEFGPVAVRQFTSGPRTFRFAVHHTGSEAELDGLVRDVEKIVGEEGAIFGEFPDYEPGTYTFLADYLPYASPDGMEHRNSTVMTQAGAIATNRGDLLDTVAHEFLHGWNVERIRPKDLEPFVFDRANMSELLWLAEGFTQYYGPLVLQRAGLISLSETTATLTSLVNTVMFGPGRAVRSAVDMSRMAPFIDGGRPMDRTNWSTTAISYYSFGGAIALALDLSLRDRSDGKVSLDDFMRVMWRRYGKPGGAREGYVDHPYTVDDAESGLAEVSGDAGFARDFFARYIAGREVADYRPLLLRAGFVLRPYRAGRAWWGDVDLTMGDRGARVARLVPPGSPAYTAGLDQDDEVREIDGAPVQSPDDVRAIIERRRPGDAVSVTFAERSGVVRTARVTLAENPHVEIVPVESGGGALTPQQRAFRERWLGRRRP